MDSTDVSAGPRTTYVVASLGRSATVPVHVARYAACLASELTPVHLIFLMNVGKYPSLRDLKDNWGTWVWPFIEESKRAFLHVSFQFDKEAEMNFENQKESHFILAGGDQRWLLSLYLTHRQDGDKLLSDFDPSLQEIEITKDEWLEIVRLRGETNPTIQNALENVEEWLEDYFQVNEKLNKTDPTRLILGLKNSAKPRWYRDDRETGIGAPQIRTFFKDNKKIIANLPGSILKFSDPQFDEYTSVKFHPDLSKYLRHTDWSPRVDTIELLLITPKNSSRLDPGFLTVLSWDSGNSMRSAERLYAALEQEILPIGLIGFTEGDLAIVKETLERLNYAIELELHSTLERLGYDDVRIDLDKGFNGKQIAMVLEAFMKHPEVSIQFDAPEIGLHLIKDGRWTALLRAVYHNFQSEPALFPKNDLTTRHTSYPFQGDAGRRPQKILFTHAPFVPLHAQKGKEKRKNKAKQNEVTKYAFPEHRVLILDSENKPLFLLNANSTFLCEFLFTQMIEIYSDKCPDVESILIMEYRSQGKDESVFPGWILDHNAHFPELKPQSQSPSKEDGPTPEAWMYNTVDDALMVFDAKCRGFSEEERQNLGAEIRSVASKYLSPRNSGTMKVQIFSAYTSDMDHEELQHDFQANHGYLASGEDHIRGFGLERGFDLSALSDWFFGDHVTTPYIDGEHQSETVRKWTSSWEGFETLQDIMYRNEHLELIHSGEDEISTTSSVAFLFFPKNSKPGEDATCINPTPLVKIVEWVARGMVRSNDLMVEAEGNEFVIHHDGKKRICASEFVDVLQTMETLREFLNVRDSETFSSYLESKLLFGTIADVVPHNQLLLDGCRALLHQLNLLDGLDLNIEPSIPLSKSLKENLEPPIIDFEPIRTVISDRIRSDFEKKHKQLFAVDLFKNRIHWPWEEFLEKFKTCIHSDKKTETLAFKNLWNSASSLTEKEIELYAGAAPFVSESIHRRLNWCVKAMQSKFSQEGLRWPSGPLERQRVLFGAVWANEKTKKTKKNKTSVVEIIYRFLGIEQDMISSPFSFTDLVVIHAVVIHVRVHHLRNDFNKNDCTQAFHQLWKKSVKGTKRERKSKLKERRDQKSRFKDELDRLLNSPNESNENAPVN